MASVKYDHVTKRFGDVVAVNDLNLFVGDKEFVVLVGPSGCGKTTALRCLAGLDQVNEGQIMIGDQVVNNLPPKDRDIAMVFESYALYSHMSVYENLAFGLKMRKTPRDEIEKRVGQAGEVMGIEGLFGQNPQQLSGGHQQAVAVGRTIVRVPKVFLFDDPLRNLDAKQRVETRNNLMKLHQQLETTFIYVTHDQVEAMTMASRIAVMNHGILQQFDTPQNLYDHPDNLFVAGFIGTPAMNFFPARIRQSDGKLVADAESFTLGIPNDCQSEYQTLIDRQIILGIRPEDIYNPEFATPGISAQLVEATVDLSEFLGNEIILHLKSGEHDYLARVDPRTRASRGATMPIAFNMDKMHIFDKQSGLAIR